MNSADTSETPDAEPVIIAEFPKNKKETIRVSLTEYRGNKLLEIRSFYPSELGMKPGKGICIQRELATVLRKAIQSAERALKDDRLPSHASHSENKPAEE